MRIGTTKRINARGISGWVLLDLDEPYDEDGYSIYLEYDDRSRNLVFARKQDAQFVAGKLNEAIADGLDIDGLTDDEFADRFISQLAW